MEVLDEICRLSKEADCRLHLDGARLFNAVIASGESAARLTEGFDSISVCLSKGLGAPVGSVLVGTRSFIDRAHRWRKLFGGGMRQSGILAAAGLYALEHNIKRLADDHNRARRLAEGLGEITGLSVDQEAVQTNMVYLETKELAKGYVDRLAEKGVGCFALGDRLIRLVTHLQIDDEGIEEVIMAFNEVSH